MVALVATLPSREPPSAPRLPTPRRGSLRLQLATRKLVALTPCLASASPSAVHTTSGVLPVCTPRSHAVSPPQELTEAEIAGYNAAEKHGCKQQRDRLHEKAPLTGLNRRTTDWTASFVIARQFPLRDSFRCPRADRFSGACREDHRQAPCRIAHLCLKASFDLS